MLARGNTLFLALTLPSFHLIARETYPPSRPITFDHFETTHPNRPVSFPYRVFTQSRNDQENNVHFHKSGSAMLAYLAIERTVNKVAVFTCYNAVLSNAPISFSPPRRKVSAPLSIERCDELSRGNQRFLYYEIQPVRTLAFPPWRVPT